MDNTQLSDDQDFEHAVAHAQMMWRLSYKQECARRHADMEWNEAQANEALATGIEKDRQDRLRAQNISYNFALSEEKERKNELFWSRVLKTIATLIVVFTLIHFLG